MITYKQQEWEQIATRFTQITDKIGMRVDSGILETVIVLNALGIETSASCEGHLDHGIAAPWIDIQAVSASEGSRRVAQMFTRADEAFERQNLPSADIEAMFAEAQREQKRIKSIHLEQRKKLMEYLSTFYTDRHVPYDQQIVIHPRDTTGRARLESIGADLQLIVPPTLREQKLAEYQREMQAFTAFLKHIYFSA
jgi:hypothetical protein